MSASQTPTGRGQRVDLDWGPSKAPVGILIADLNSPRIPPVPLPSPPPPILHTITLLENSAVESQDDPGKQQSYPRLTEQDEPPHTGSLQSRRSLQFHPGPPVNTEDLVGRTGSMEECSEQPIVHRNSSINSLEVVGSLSRMISMGKSFPRLSIKLEVEAEDLLEDKEVVSALSDQISFRGVEDLLRGVRLHRILRGGAAIFKDSQGSARTYELSERVDRLKYFLSHNWSVSRWDKLLALSFRLNFHAAFWVGIALCFTVGILGVIGLLPTTMAEDVPDLESQGFVARIVVLPLVFFIFIYGREPFALCGYFGPYVFLDKVCIHQTNKQMQRDAIDRLGAFLRASDRMIVFYSSDYLRRLWTIYEIANFLTLRRMECVEVIPVVFSRVVAIMMPLCYAYNIVTLSTMMAHEYIGKSLQLSARYLTVGAGAYAYLRISRRWQIHKSKIQKILITFQVQSCTCAVDSDRAIIYQKIAALMRASRKVGRTATLEEALAAFNQEVQCRMPEAFGSFLGASSLRYIHYIFFGFCLVAPQLVDNLAGYDRGKKPKQVIVGAGHEMIWLVVLWPFLIRATEAMAGKFRSLRGWREKVWVVVVIAFGAFPGIGFHTALSAWTDRAATDPDAFRRFVIFVSVTTSLTFLICFFVSHLRFSRRNNNDQPAGQTPRL